jgi:hyperosmotically inducible periplasmic protein
MKTFNFCKSAAAIAVIGLMAGCAHTTKSPDVSESIRKALDQAGLKTVSVSQDRDKGVVTLGGNVVSDANKSQADSIANSMAAGQVVADQIAVIPPGAAASTARDVNADLDKGIQENLDAALLQSKLHDGVRFSVKNHVVTLTGEVDSQTRRQQVQQVAAAVPNVAQVVNELQVKNQKATSSE